MSVVSPVVRSFRPLWFWPSRCPSPRTLGRSLPRVCGDVDTTPLAILAQIDPRRGTQTLGDGIATAEVAQGQYSLDPAASELVLEDAWGIPRGAFGHDFLG